MTSDTVNATNRTGKKSRHRFNNMRDNWTNETKEQPYLMPGTPEYEEYIADLKANDPLQPDDEMHEVLEDYNEDLSERLAEKADQNGSERADFQKAKRQAQKRALQSAAKAKAIREAMKTANMSDDELAKMITSDNPIVYNDGVTPDEYVNALSDYVMDSCK